MKHDFILVSGMYRCVWTDAGSQWKNVILGWVMVEKSAENTVREKRAQLRPD